MIPAAMLELIRRYFGFAALPNFSATLAALDRDPYRPVREALSSAWSLVDLTDYNSDLGNVYVLTDRSQPVTVRLSFVGPYALILTSAGEIADAPDVAELLDSEGFHLLERSVLETPVRVWEPEAEGTVYEFLFEFDEGLPWAR